MQRGDEITLTLESAAFEGKTIAHMDGLVVFVRGGVPGDTGTVRLTKIKKQFLEADFTRLIHPSPDRVPAPCKHFGVCGGCKWQQLSYPVQIAYKRQHVLDALERIGGFRGIEVLPTVGAERTLFYRNKMEFSFGARWRSTSEMLGGADTGRVQAEGNDGTITDWALGLHIPERFDRVLDVDSCLLQSETSTRIVNLTRQFARERGLTVYSTKSHTGYLRNLVVRESRHTGERMVNLVTSDDRPDLVSDYAAQLLNELPSITTIVNNITERKSQVAVGEYEKVYHGPGSIMEMIGRRKYRISANSFFQTNTEQAERLYEVVRSMAGLSGHEVVFDLYSGTGSIALHLADQAQEVVGIESVPQAVEDAHRNADFNGVGNCTFLLGDLKDRLTKDASWRASHPDPHVVILDPPRSGMHEAVTRQVLTLGAQRIVYVSCNPTTQARDLKILTESGTYAIRQVQPLDMFPHTYHIENVVLLARTTDQAH
ncbi:MAG: 23S rRNA (uracil(1939)-C(5))-methyltransferase RlmD [Bacteroidota bacterium]